MSDETFDDGCPAIFSDGYAPEHSPATNPACSFAPQSSGSDTCVCTCGKEHPCDTDPHQWKDDA